MGTRINVLFDHDLTDHRDREAVLARIASALPAALAVRDYWLEVASKAPSRLEREARRRFVNDG